MSVTEEQVLSALRDVQDPDLHKDIVTLGFLPGALFDLVLGPGASANVLGVTFTFVFGSFDSGGNFTPSDVDENGRTSPAFVIPQRDPAFYDSFLWTYNLPEFVYLFSF